MKEDIERLKRIYNDLKQQCDDKSCPIMILAEIDAEDLDFMRKHIKIICWAYEMGMEYGRTLLTYLIMDYVYENYAADQDESVNMWPLIDQYLSNYIDPSHKDAYSYDEKRKTIMDVLETLGLPEINYGKRYQNTVLLNSSSRHYSDRFFDYISNEYHRMIERDVEYDLSVIGKRISLEFKEDQTKVTQMSHSFGLLIKDENIFPDIFDRVINKLDQRMKNDMEYDIGRWEEAFNDWYLKAENAKDTRSKAELSLIECNGGYSIHIEFPSSKAVPRQYWVDVKIGNLTRRIDIPIVKIRGVNCSRNTGVDFQVHTIDVLGKISARDSTGIILLNIPGSDYRMFYINGNYANRISPGTYKMFIRKGIDHDLPVFFTDSVTEQFSFIQTELESNTAYRIGASNIVFERKLSKNSISIQYPSLGETYARVDNIAHIVPRHPTLIFETNVDRVHISIKGYDGRPVFNKYLDVSPGNLNINSLIEPESGVYRLSITYEKYRLVSVRYLLIRDLSFRVDDVVCPDSSGDIPFTDSDGDDILIFYRGQMFVEYPVGIHGKTFECKVKTPMIFFNPHPSTNEDDWRLADSDTIDTNDLEGTMLIAPGCIPAGQEVHLMIRSPRGVSTISDNVSDGICSFPIYDIIRSLQEEKLPFTIEMRYNDRSFPIFKVNTLGKYDIDIKNDIVAVTPYYMPSNCIARYEYHTDEISKAGLLELNSTVLFDIHSTSSVLITESNLDTNDELIIYQKKDPATRVHTVNIDDPYMDPMERVKRLLAGDGCRQDQRLAFKILQGMSDEGNEDATLMLARMYLMGSSTAIDLQRSADYFERYLEQKDNPDFDSRSL